MEIHLANVLQSSVGLLVGGVIGYSFGVIQDAARLRNEKRQQMGKLGSALSIMPGSGARVAYLLIALVLIQVLCPLLFADGTQWWVSGGLVAGYGWLLFRKMMLLRKVGRI